ncbi:hypothetical protein Tco_1086995 [Tanacetum coccineum]
MAWMGRNADIKDGDSVNLCVKEKQSSLADKSVEVSKHVDEALGTNSPTRTPNVVNAGLGSYPTLSEAHGHSTASANEEDMNVVGTKDECPKYKSSDVAKNLKNPIQDLRGVPVGPKVGFKPVKQVYRALSKKNIVNTSGNKKKDVESRKEVVKRPILVDLRSGILLEQWRDTYENADYDYDPYDDDMYEGQEIPDNVQSICDNLDIKLRGRKKK